MTAAWGREITDGFVSPFGRPESQLEVSAGSCTPEDLQGQDPFSPFSSWQPQLSLGL